MFLSQVVSLNNYKVEGTSVGVVVEQEEYYRVEEYRNVAAGW